MLGHSVRFEWVSWHFRNTFETMDGISRLQLHADISKTHDNADFEEQMETDPTGKPMGMAVRKLDVARKAYMKVKNKSSSFVSAQRGKLPAGIASKKWESED